MTDYTEPDELGDDYARAHIQPVSAFDNHDSAELNTLILTLPSPDEPGFAAVLDDALEAQALADEGKFGLAWRTQRDLLIRYIDADSDEEARDKLRELSQPEMQAAFNQLMDHLEPKKRSGNGGPRSQSRSRPKRPKKRPRGRR